MPDLKNKVVWLTGASSGIGEALAYALAKKNCRLILSSRRTDELQRVKKQCAGPPQNICILQVDLNDALSLMKATEDALQCFGHIDILINNGGISQRSTVLETSMEVFRRLFEVNFFGAIALTKYLLPHFISRKQGQFVVISSVAGKYSPPKRSGYAATKHALHGFYDSLRAEYWQDNIKVTIVCPGMIKTSISFAALMGDGTPNNKMDEMQEKGMPAEECALQIVSAVEQEKAEVNIGGKEVLMVYIKRFVPALYRRIIRKVVMR
jgi:short-subunit dehydrogenase